MGINNQEIKYQIDHRLKTAHDLQGSGKVLHAVQIYNSLINDFPEHTEAYFRLAELYEIIDNLKPAIILLKNLLEKYPDNNDVRLFLGQFLLRNSMWREANDILDSILSEEEPITSFFLGYSHFMLKEYELSKINFLNFISFEDQSELLHEAYLYLTKAEIELENYENALAFAKKAELLYNNFWELNLLFGISYYHLGMYAHAILPIEKAIKLNTSEASSREWAGKIYLKSGDFLKAEENFLKYIELKEDASSEIYSNLGEACFSAKKPVDAKAYFEIALKLNPNNKFAKNGLRKTSTLLEHN
ncbi:MAG TPA: tetratricopeptide repeat protein [Ignavibacteriaceae bacterium]|nr:tetratricopeptide repeat protein [Ignavibacteriaceae bacterium]